MNRILSLAIALSIAFPQTLFADPHGSTNAVTSNANYNPDDPQIFTTSVTEHTQDGTERTLVQTQIIAEGEEQIAKLEAEEVREAADAMKNHEDITVFDMIPANSPESDAAVAENRAKLSFVPSESFHTYKVETSLLARGKQMLKGIGERVAAAKDKVLSNYYGWLMGTKERPRRVTTAARLSINGVNSALVFISSYGVNHDAGTALMFTIAGLMVGSMSGFVHYMSPYYTNLLNRANEFWRTMIWATMETCFIVAPATVLKYGPDKLNAWAHSLLGNGTHLDFGRGVLYASSWPSAIFTSLISLALGFYAQYFFDVGNSQATEFDKAEALKRNDPSAYNAAVARMYTIFVAVSVAQVGVFNVTMSGNLITKLLGYVGLGGLGATGMYYRYRVTKRIKASQVAALVNEINGPKSCPQVILEKSPIDAMEAVGASQMPPLETGSQNNDSAAAGF